MRPAVFLDRDGTLIEHVHHLADPARVRLIEGAAEAVRLLGEHGYACVVVTNQSVVGRGLLTLEGLSEIHAEMHRQLAEKDARLDGLYYCPLAPGVGDRSTIEHEDRKPGPGMVLRAAREMELDVGRSWMVGDMLSDLLCGRNSGCRGSILVRTGQGGAVPADHETVDHVASDVWAAAGWIVNQREARGPERGSSTYARS